MSLWLGKLGNHASRYTINFDWLIDWLIRHSEFHEFYLLEKPLGFFSSAEVLMPSATDIYFR